MGRDCELMSSPSIALHRSLSLLVGVSPFSFLFLPGLVWGIRRYYYTQHNDGHGSLFSTLSLTMQFKLHQR